MKVYIGTDHRGFHLAEKLSIWLRSQNILVVNVGATQLDSQDDYVDFADEVAQQVTKDSTDETRGILLCGSGVGMDIAANKVSGIRCCLGYSEEQIQAARNDDAINVLALGANYLDLQTAKKLVQIFLQTPFANEERYIRRIKKITHLEQR